MLKKVFTIVFTILSTFLFAQESLSIKGTVKDAATGETVIGAIITLSNGKTAATDFDGNYSIPVEVGDYTVTVTYVGYTAQTQKVKVTTKSVTVVFSFESKVLNEVEIVADVARARETPVAFSTISALKIQEELGSRDLPMLLNSTPGVYATEQGGGAGDARINIRGFDQRNVAVMVDGVPVNDMENGQVYWSNWDGLGEITRNMQVQRGLGASKLGIASVGGTMNIITKGIDSKKGGVVKQEVGNNGMLRTSVGYTTGVMDNGFGVTAALSYKRGNGWVDQTWHESFSYFFKVQKKLGKHLLSLGANGAPQKHGQRIDRLPVAIFDKEFAKKLGVSDSSISAQYNNLAFTTKTQGERGLRYNPAHGLLNGESVNERVNYYHKPLISLSDYWTPNDKLYISNVAYLSIGNGGGTGLSSSINRDTLTGQLNFQETYDANVSDIAIDKLYSDTEHKASRYLRASENNHVWYGLLSTANYKLTHNLNFTGGLDLRGYQGKHRQVIYDLLGADYVIDASNNTVSYDGTNITNSIKRKGDVVRFNNLGLVRWGGLFGQAEYKTGQWTAFFTATFSKSAYKRVDYFAKRDLVLPDTTLRQVINASQVLTFRGNQYDINSPEVNPEVATPWRIFTGYTLKTGANYNITENHNLFVNIGYLTIPPRYNNVFDNSNREFLAIKQQFISGPSIKFGKSIINLPTAEFGYGMKYKKFAINLNGYYTVWRNKPPSFTPSVILPSGERLSYNINGMDAIHKGIEADFTIKLLQNLEWEGLFSIGDWIYNSEQLVYIYDQNEQLVDSVEFGAIGVHVGDAAQFQLGSAIKYSFKEGIFKNLFFKPRITYFGKNYANFDPLNLTVVKDLQGNIISDNRNRESWQMPNYYLLDLYSGYSFKFKKLDVNINAGVINILNTIYISDAQNGANADATTSLVYFGMGRRWNIGMKVTF